MTKFKENDDVIILGESIGGFDFKGEVGKIVGILPYEYYKVSVNNKVITYVGSKLDYHTDKVVDELIESNISQSKVDSLVIISGENKAERIEIEANYCCWKYMRDNNIIRDLLVIDVYEEDNVSAMTAISLEQMKQLRDYLNHKIEYMESEEV